MPDARILAVSGVDLLAMKDEVAVVGRPPSGGDVRKPGFRACTARGTGGRLIGIAYGWEGGPGDRWWDIAAAAVNADVRRRWFDDCLDLVELVVAPEERRRGIGGALHDALLALTERPHVVGSVREDAADAMAFCGSKGWRTVHPGLRFPGNDAVFAVLVRDR